MRSADSFFYWAYKTRADIVNRILAGEEIPQEKIFLSFCSHTPAFVSNGPDGLNASIKGIGLLPKPEYLEEIYEIYLKHIDSYDPSDNSYSLRGLAVLANHFYAPELLSRLDFTRFGSLEMSKKHSWNNYRSNPEATLLFYQPPAISYELRGSIGIHDENISGKREIYQMFINAQHDVYHGPDKSRNDLYPAYIFNVKEVWDNSANKEGFGTKLHYP